MYFSKSCVDDRLFSEVNMKKTLKFVVLVGILTIAAWAPPSMETPAYADCSGYPSCSFLAGKGCTSSRACCDGPYEGYCVCSGGRYFCSV